MFPEWTSRQIGAATSDLAAISNRRTARVRAEAAEQSRSEELDVDAVVDAAAAERAAWAGYNWAEMSEADKRRYRTAYRPTAEFVARIVRAEAVAAERQRIVRVIRRYRDTTSLVGTAEYHLTDIAAVVAGSVPVATSEPTVTQNCPHCGGWNSYSAGKCSEHPGPAATSPDEAFSDSPQLAAVRAAIEGLPVGTDGQVLTRAFTEGIAAAACRALAGPVATPTEPVKCWCNGAPSIWHPRGIEGCRFAPGGDLDLATSPVLAEQPVDHTSLLGMAASDAIARAAAGHPAATFEPCGEPAPSWWDGAPCVLPSRHKGDCVTAAGAAWSGAAGQPEER
jgi:hypothetical protein